MSEGRHVRGILFLDYVRMIRSHKTIDWEEHLHPEDLMYLTEQMYLSSWYPMASYERMGLAILDQIAHGDLERAREWGRVSVDAISTIQPQLVVARDPRETFQKFHVLRATLFDFPAFETRTVEDGRVVLHLDFGMSDMGEKAACWQAIGFLERLLEIAGAKDIDVRLASSRWSGAESTTVEARWRTRTAVPDPSSPGDKLAV